MKPISKGDEITIHYVGISLGNIARKKSFKNHWKFECNCNRCQDPSEFGTNLQAIKCEDCLFDMKIGYLLPVYDTDKENSYSKVYKSDSRTLINILRCITCLKNTFRVMIIRGLERIFFSNGRSRRRHSTSRIGQSYLGKRRR